MRNTQRDCGNNGPLCQGKLSHEQGYRRVILDKLHHVVSLQREAKRAPALPVQGFALEHRVFARDEVRSLIEFFADQHKTLPSMGISVTHAAHSPANGHPFMRR